MRFDAYHLPALDQPPTTSWSYGGEGSEPLDVRVARLTPRLLSLQIDRLLAAREDHLAPRPVAQVVAVIDRVARRLLDSGDPLRAEALTAVAAVTGLSLPMVGRVLDGMAADWVADRLQSLLQADLGDAGAIDDFVPRPRVGGRTRAFGPPLVLHVFSGSVPGVAVTSLIRALLVKAASLGKTAAGEPVLAPLFARALADADPRLGECVAVTYWAGGNEALERQALERAGAVIGYGGRETIAALRERTPPEIPFLGYGHRVSFGAAAREALRQPLATELAADAALAVAMFDQQGCVSPHLFYVEEGGEVSPREWARMVAEQMAALEQQLPRGSVAPGEAAAIRQLRGEAEFAQISRQGHELYASPGGTVWTVVYEPSADFVPSCLHRVVRIKPIASLETIPATVRVLASVLQTVGLEGPEARIRPVASDLGRWGVSRITSFREMAWPSPLWHHDGRPALGDLVRWVDWE